jgi:protoporphyrinogen/coproporphyrinogen III oxidase
MSAVSFFSPVDNPAEHTLPIAIVGAGLTGMSAAHHLRRAGRSVVLLDAAPEPGGVIRSERHPDGWLIESGPNSLQETPAVAALVRELGLADSRLEAAPAAKNRYILRDGKLRPLPLSPPSFFRSDVFSARTKFRVFRELFRRRRPRLNDLPLADFFREHFGQELLDYALDPFVSGIYAGDASRLSARHSFPSLWKAEHEHGSLIRAQIKSAKAKRARGEASGPPPVVSFAEGLAALPRALAASFPPGSLRLGSPVSRLSPSRAGWILDAAPAERFSRVILALPAPALARLAVGSPGALASLASLDHLEHPAVASIFLGFRREQIAHPLDGFGVLFPSTEKRPLLGVLFNSTLFPGRAPEGHVALTVMVGGARHGELARQPLEQQLPVVLRELSEILGAKGAPVFARRTLWPRAIPQYQLNHDAHLEVIAAAEHRHAGLFIGGPVRDGIGLPACLAAGERLARAALA